MSLRRRTTVEEYTQRRLAFLVRHPFCHICARRELKQKASQHIHHKRGRAGSLMLDERFWMASCERCHDWVHSNMVAARKIGCLCSIGEWNTVPRP